MKEEHSETVFCGIEIHSPPPRFSNLALVFKVSASAVIYLDKMMMMTTSQIEVANSKVFCSKLLFKLVL